MKTHKMISEQIDAINDEAERLDVSPLQLRDTNGNYVLTPLLAAKAQILYALVLLNQKEKG